MLKNQLKIIWRSLLKNKMTSFINLTGLIIGLSAAILIGLFVFNEWQTDRSLPYPDQTFRLLRSSYINSEPYDIGITSAPFSPALIQDFPDAIEQTVRVLPAQSVLKVDDDVFQEPNYYYVDSNFLHFFGFELLYGDVATALTELHSVVLTNETAIKLFKSPENAIGQLIHVDNSYDVQVTGVLAKITHPTHFKFSVLESTQELAQANWWSNWWNNNLCTYVRLFPAVEAEQMNAAFPQFMDKYFEKDFLRNGSRIDLKLQPVRDVYFEGTTRYDPMRHGDVNALQIFVIAVLLLLIVAAANYINLATAQASGKAKQIGVLKTLGSSRKQILSRSLLESGLLVSIAVFLAFQISTFLKPGFEQLLGATIQVEPSPLSLVIVLLGLIVTMTLISGLYPGLYLAAFKPVTVLRGHFKTGSGRPNTLRKGMVVFQYAISTMLLLCTFLIYQQLTYLQSKDLGFDREFVVLMDINNPDIFNSKDLFKERLLRSPSIRTVSFSSGEPGGFHDATTVQLKEENQSLRMRTCFADFDYFDAFGLEMLAGRKFDRNLTSDSVRAVVLNERAVADLGQHPDEILGRELLLTSFDSIPRQVIGVVKDYHFTSLHSKIEPLLIAPMRWAGKIAVKIDRHQVRDALAVMEDNWQNIAPDFPFAYQFLDETLEQQYLNENRQSKLFQFFALVAVLIAGLGMFGLAFFTTVSRSKEIGMRKILGSDFFQIIILLTRDFLLLVLIAALIGCPLAWYFMRYWLTDFAYHISIPIWIFFVVVVISILMAALAIAFHTIKASLLNPAEILREVD